MKKFVDINKNIKKDTLRMCKEVADECKYQTAPMTMYLKIRGYFTIAKTIDNIVEENGYNRELVENVYNETFGVK